MPAQSLIDFESAGTMPKMADRLGQRVVWVACLRSERLLVRGSTLLVSVVTQRSSMQLKATSSGTM